MCARRSDLHDSSLEPRKAPRQPRSQQMREDLLDGAARVLAERGHDGFTTNHVARATGVSVGSVYQYFPNKGALLAAVHEREARAVWSELEQVLRDDARPHRERLDFVVQAACDAQAHGASLERAMVNASVDGTATRGFGALEAQIIEGLARFIEGSRSCQPDEAERLGRTAFLFLSASLKYLVDAPEECRTVSADTANALAGLLGLPPA